MSYEARDAPLKVIGFAAALVAALVIASIASSRWLYYARYHGPGPVPTTGRQPSFATTPSAEPDILRDWRQVNANASRRLHSYGWVDRKSGVARIPIDRAMALVAAGHKPAPAPPAPGQVSP